MAHEGRSRGRRRGSRVRRLAVGDGPFSGHDVARALADAGFELESAGDGEVELYINHATGKRVPVNPGWRVHPDDAIFRTVVVSSGLDADRLRQLLGRH